MNKFRNIMNKRTVFQIKSRLVATSLWGIFETTLLTIIGWIDRWIWPNFHSRFMRIMHGHFGSIVIPSEIQLERSHDKRSWQNRTEIEEFKINKDRIKDQTVLKKGDVLILPNEELLNLLMRSNMRVTVGDCFCRTYAKKHGKKCKLDAPIKTCMTFYLPQSLEDILTGEPRPKLIKKKEELYKKIKKWEKIGLVHQVIWFQQNSTYVVCNCCPCCCEVLGPHFESIEQIKYHERKIIEFEKLQSKIENQNRSPKKVLSQTELKEYNKLKKNIKYHERSAQLEPTPVVVKSAFISKNIDSTKCTNCGKCEERCYFGARRIVHGQMHYEPDLCTGCGLCVSTCPTENIILERRKIIKNMNKNGKGIKHIHPHGKIHHIHNSKKL
ncbi:MAG: hypothetical protein GF364_14900 [Candidatus Lokiarchaeota archaeon]|nr:hypothetical protein [Candidatus Lokiarchaeota archaeon]